MTSSSLLGKLWLLPRPLTSKPDHWVSWNPAAKDLGFHEKWKIDPSTRKAANEVIDTIGRLPYGIARVFEGDIAALDLDKAVTTPRDLSTLAEWARPIVDAALGNGYLEWSHSGLGIHILLRDVPEGDWRRKRNLRRYNWEGRNAEGNAEGGWDWIIGSNLCHITMDVISQQNHGEMIPASRVIPMLEQLLEASNSAKPKPEPRPVVAPSMTVNTELDLARQHHYGEKAMEDEISKLAQALKGERNNSLNLTAFALGQLYGGGYIDDVAKWTSSVISVGELIGLDPREVQKTFESGFNGGQKNPRGPLPPPERQMASSPRAVANVATVSPPVATVSSQQATGQGTTQKATRTLQSRQFTSLIHAADLHQLPNTDWLIDKLIGRGVITQLYGKPGSGKSLTALDIALTMAQQHMVVYAPGEAPGELRDRIDAWCQYTQSTVGQLYIYPNPVNLRDHDEISALADECRARGAAMLVIDPLAESLGVAGLDENTAVDMGVAIAALRSLMAQAGDPALLLVHHAGWDDAHERGSSALRGACRVVVRAQADADDNRVTLRVDKANSGKPFEELYYGLAAFGSSVVLVPHHTAKPSANAPLSPTQLNVLKALMLEQYSDGATQASICDATGMSRQTVSKSVDRLLKRNMIRRENTILHIEFIGRTHVNETEAAGGIRTTVMSSVDGRYNWRVAPPVARVEPEATYDPQPCPPPVASVSPGLSPGLSPVASSNLSPDDGDKPLFCPPSPEASVATMSPATHAMAAQHTALQSETAVEVSPVSPVSPPCRHDVPDPCPLSPSFRGSIKTPEATKQATEEKGQSQTEYVVVGTHEEAMSTTVTSRPPQYDIDAWRADPDQWWARYAPDNARRDIVTIRKGEADAGTVYLVLNNTGRGVLPGTCLEGYTTEAAARAAAKAQGVEPMAFLSPVLLPVAAWYAPTEGDRR